LYVNRQGEIKFLAMLTDWVVRSGQGSKVQTQFHLWSRLNQFFPHKNTIWNKHWRSVYRRDSLSIIHLGKSTTNNSRHWSQP